MKHEHKVYLSQAVHDYLMTMPAGSRSEFIDTALNNAIKGTTPDLQRFGQFIASVDPVLSSRIEQFYAIKPPKRGRPPNEVLTDAERLRFGVRKSRTPLQQSELEDFQRTRDVHGGNIEQWEKNRNVDYNPHAL